MKVYAYDIDLIIRRVALVRTDDSEERIATTIKVTRIGALGTTLAVTSKSSPETSVVTRGTRCHIPDDGILQNHRRDNLKSYAILFSLPLS
jgi:hypothetical protein